PAPAPRPTPVPTGAPVRVTQGTPLPTPSVQASPRPLPGSQGALPAPKVLAPVLQAEAPKTELGGTPPVLTPPSGLVETPLPVQKKEGEKAEPPPPPKTPLQTLVEERGLKLTGTLLGPVSVAILESKEGYLVLPVGSLLPGSEAVLRRIESDRVVLALKDESLEIVLDSMQAGGGQ
ncbi:competence protein, partial [Thermus scotoductus]